MTVNNSQSVSPNMSVTNGQPVTVTCSAGYAIGPNASAAETMTTLLAYCTESMQWGNPPSCLSK